VARGNRAVRPGLSDAFYPRAFIVPLTPGIGKRLNRNDIARRLGPQASLSRVGYEHVARGSRGRLKIFGTQNSRVLLSTM
jgi:hypothetical protein